MRYNEDNLILKLCVSFSLDIIIYTEKLKEQKMFPLANQLFKSGTSIGANIFEAQTAESNNDFIHKLKIADKEASETEYWLLLCSLSNQIETDEKLIENLTTIQKVLSKIISTSKKK
jgi:four helix bundle protein